MDAVVANLTGQLRRERLAGRNYLVAPATLIVPGVLNGSEGPLYYSHQLINQRPEVWNNIPIVLNHPTDDLGRHISARSPRGMKNSLGMLFNTKANGKLASETWFDEGRLEEVDPILYQRLLRGEKIELSTGLHTQTVMADPQNHVRYQMQTLWKGLSFSSSWSWGLHRQA